jgi:hypothetical protein
MKGQRDHQEQSGVYRVSRRLEGEECKANQGGKERANPLARRRLAECTASVGLCKECNERSTRTDKNNPVGTLSGGGWMERQIEPIKAAKKWKTRRVYRIGLPLRGV